MSLSTGWTNPHLLGISDSEITADYCDNGRKTNSVPSTSLTHTDTHTHTQVYLVSDLLPLHLQHLLLLIGVIDDVLSADQQLALHRLRDTNGYPDSYLWSRSCVVNSCSSNMSISIGSFCLFVYCVWTKLTRNPTRKHNQTKGYCSCRDWLIQW